ncbi:spore germination protein [Thermoclostridium stercorarium]|uniref:Spore gernimation protein n=1 Tax=Thermoclostridium stercorarium subsp. leptospartum DSM 9219 TaxID=1346611 RepID=A0A1B1YMM7_THEST|nr:endospore germination permease [Thermoclostridium stercorarium]ANX02037.1 spore gernimation protein [Thermoclostridium stercorarium subsp. leptospartum DSM 9219]UZQ85099.1 spore germination protein [Thermoclostridium stercorarium]
MSKEKIQISPLQLTFLFITMVISTADIFTPSFVAQEAKGDSWISVILASVAMIPVLFIYMGLYKQYREKSLIEICDEIAGKVAGKIIGFLYVFYFIFIALGATMSLTIVLNITFLPMTPPWIIVLVSVLVALYGVYSNLEVVARVNEILLPAGMGALVFLLLLNINEYDFDFFRPVLADGILNPVRGAVIIFGYLGETVVILQMLHLVNKSEKITTAVFAGLLITGMAILAGTLIYAVFGPLTEVFIIPSLELARFSSIGKYIQNLDVLILAIWITGIYVKIMIFIYAGTYAMSQLFRLKSYKSVILPVGFFLCSVTFSNVDVRVTELSFMHYIVPVYAIAMSFIIPGILLLIGKIKSRKKGKGQKE